MTLIACTVNYGFPVMIADILLTSEISEESIQLPTNAKDISPFLDNGNPLPISLAQKIYIIAPNVCVSFAGYSNRIIHFLREFRLRLSYYSPNAVTHSQVEDFLAEYDHPPIDELAYFISIVDSSAEIPWQTYLFPSSAWRALNNNSFETTFASGSGASGFLNQVSNFGIFTSNFLEGSPTRALQSNFGMTARLLAAEKISLFNIKEYWGGGYEVVFFNGEAFEKCDDYDYLLFRGEFNENGDIDRLTPELVLHYKYYNKFLGITALEPSATIWNLEEGMFTFTSNLLKRNHFMIPSIDPTDSVDLTDAPQDYSFETDTVGLGYGLIVEGRKIYTPSIFNQDKRHLSIRYTDRGGLKIKMNPLIDNILRNAAKEKHPELVADDNDVYGFSSLL